MRRLMDNRGFTYLSLLFLITVMGLAASAAGKAWSTGARREMEEELIFRGSEIRRAIGRYYEESPGAKAYPRAIEDLIKDPRYPATKRHLRRLYSDPFTGKPDWGVIRTPEGWIIGVRPGSDKEPYKKGNFPKELAGLEGKTRYSEWEFAYYPEKK